MRIGALRISNNSISNGKYSNSKLYNSKVGEADQFKTPNSKLLILVCALRKSVVSLHVRNLLLQLSYLLFLEHTLVLDRDNLDEVLDVAVPVVEHGAGEL